MIPKSAQQHLLTLGCNAEKISDLVSGVKLATIINKVFYGGNNITFENKIIKDNEQRKGNNVININIILKQIKNDQNIHCPEEIRNLTSFVMIEDQNQMMKFVDWLLEQANSSHKGFESAPSPLDFSDKKNTNKNEANKGADSFLMKQERKTISQLASKFEIQNQSSPYEGDNDTDKAFENVFFCDRDIEPQHVDIGDSLDGSAQKVVKKGSFKIIRPKTHFDHKEEQQLNKNTSFMNEKSKKRQELINQSSQFVQPKFTISQEYHVKDYRNDSSHNIGKDQETRELFQQKEPQARKTVPKIAQRPPIYKKAKQQQTIKAQSKIVNNTSSFFKTPAPFNSAALSSNGSSRKSSLDHQRQSHSQSLKKMNQNLFREVQDLDEEIKNQKRSIKEVSRSSAKRSQTSNRKVFKLQINQVCENQKRSIVQWLISINLLNSMAAEYYDKLHQICRNGVIFPQIINHQKGRGAEIGYFKKPKRSAQVHSNYQKVFTFLKDIPTFDSQLLFHYEYFVPEAQEPAFWSFLNSCKNAFQKKLGDQNSRVFTRDSEIKSRITSKKNEGIASVRKMSSERKNSTITSQNLEPQYQKIRYGSNKKQLRTDRSRSACKYPPPKIYTPSHNKNSQDEELKSKRKTSIQFIKQLPQKIYRHEDLIQVQEPKEDQNESRNKKGYRNLHQMKKNHTHNSYMNLNTPTKKSADVSINRSRIISTNSMKKKQQILPVPSISLQMEMKALKYLKEKGMFNPMAPGLNTLSLFEDPIRNGTLFNIIIKEECQLNYKFIQRPRNIQDCRQNFRTGFQQLKSAFSMIPLSFEHHFQQIIRGQMNLFYGIIWHLAFGGRNSGKVGVAISNPLKNQSAILNLSQHGNHFELNIEQQTERIISWVRILQQQSNQISVLQIRDINSLYFAIVSRNLLFKIAKAMTPQKYTLKPTYQNPINSVQQESNLKKILSFFTHNKILKSQNAWKARSFVMKDNKTILGIMKDLMNYYSKLREKLYGNNSSNMNRCENSSVTFLKYARKNNNNSSLEMDKKVGERNNDRLQTTMANHSFGPDTQQLFPPKQQKINRKNPESSAISIQIPWMRKLGYTGDLSLNNGVILCRLISQMTMQTISFTENPSSKAQGLTNIRKALKIIEKFKWDEYDISNADERTNKEVYKFLKDKYKNSYAMKMAL